MLPLPGFQKLGTITVHDPEFAGVEKAELEALFSEPFADLCKGTVLLLDLWQVIQEEKDLGTLILQILLRPGRHQNPVLGTVVEEFQEKRSRWSPWYRRCRGGPIGPLHHERGGHSR